MFQIIANIIRALAALCTAAAPIIGLILSYKLKNRALDIKHGSADNEKTITPAIAEEIFRLILTCIIIFSITGASTSLMGALDNYDGVGSMFFEKYLCWLVGNCTVLALAIRHTLSR